jgi:hypothetical protein
MAVLYSNEISSKEIAQRFESQMRNNSVSIVTSQEFPQNSDSVKLAEYVEKVRISCMVIAVSNVSCCLVLKISYMVNSYLDKWDPG